MGSDNPVDMNPKGAAGRAKPQFHLIPVGALAPVAKVMELGAKKYGPYNWRETPVNYTTYLSAVGRHAAAFLDGEDQDPESGQSHLAHIAAGMMILLDAIVTGNAKDDRPRKNPAYAGPEPTPVKPKTMADLIAQVKAELPDEMVVKDGLFQGLQGACPCSACTRLRELIAEHPGGVVA